MRHAAEHEASDSLPATCAHENQIRSQRGRLLQNHGGRCPVHGDSVRLITDSAQTFCHALDVISLLFQYLSGGGSRRGIIWPWRLCRRQDGQQRHLNRIVKRLELEKTNSGFCVGRALKLSLIHISEPTRLLS